MTWSLGHLTPKDVEAVKNKEKVNKYCSISRWVHRNEIFLKKTFE